jgi:hypothetical protein
MSSPTFKLISLIDEIDADGGIGLAIVEVTGTIELVFKVITDNAGAHLADSVTANLEQTFRRDILVEMLRQWFLLP